MKRSPVVSIVTPTKNRLPLLREAMASVAAQTYPNWEHLIVDDGSVDGTVEALVDGRDPRVRFMQREGDQTGANVCRNIGIRAARGDYVIFLDSDDLLDPHCLDDRVAMMQRNADIDLAIFQTSVFKREPGDLNRLYDSDIAGDHLLRFLYMELPWTITGPIWRRSALMDLGLLDPSLPSMQDVELHVRALTKGLRYLQSSVVDHHVRWQDDGAENRVSIQQRELNHLDAAVSTIQKFDQFVQDGPGMNWVRQRALCSLYFRVADLRLQRAGVWSALRVWRIPRAKGMAPATLHAAGAILLMAVALRLPGARRLMHKWRGWVRFRTNPEILRA